MAFLLRSGRRSRGIHRMISSIYTPSYSRPLQFIDLCGTANPEHVGNSWQRWVSADNRNGLIPLSVGNARLYSESAKQKEKGRVLEEFKHQEIEGPTVERDMSALANEVREEEKQLRKRMYDLSRGLLLLGVAQLSCGAWLLWVTKVPPFSEISVQSFFAFAFPFTFAYLVRHLHGSLGKSMATKWINLNPKLHSSFSG
ncbi:hypothetical protein SUGI_0055550 [Cryptomeria japonica]|nr:hypothetical protein SUGI_0055550 [Cryptomeria japonica]